jgi:hypothetical protein
VVGVDLFERLLGHRVVLLDDHRYRAYTGSDGPAVEYNHDHLVRRAPDYSDLRICPVLWRAT